MLSTEEYLSEVGNTTSVRTKADKLGALAGKSAMGIAKKLKSPLYTKYVILNKKRILLKDMIMKKYKNAGLALAKKTMK